MQPSQNNSRADYPVDESGKPVAAYYFPLLSFEASGADRGEGDRCCSYIEIFLLLIKIWQNPSYRFWEWNGLWYDGLHQPKLSSSSHQYTETQKSRMLWTLSGKSPTKRQGWQWTDDRREYGAIFSSTGTFSNNVLTCFKMTVFA